VARLVLTARARDQLNGLPLSPRNAVLHTLADLAVEPDVVGKPLVGRLTGIWAARVGNYRVLYTIEGSSTSQRVVVRSMRHRAVAYVVQTATPLARVHSANPRPITQFVCEAPDRGRVLRRTSRPNQRPVNATSHCGGCGDSPMQVMSVGPICMGSIRKVEKTSSPLGLPRNSRISLPLSTIR